MSYYDIDSPIDELEKKILGIVDWCYQVEIEDLFELFRGEIETIVEQAIEEAKKEGVEETYEEVENNRSELTGYYIEAKSINAQARIEKFIEYLEKNPY